MLSKRNDPSDLRLPRWAWDSLWGQENSTFKMASRLGHFRMQNKTNKQNDSHIHYNPHLPTGKRKHDSFFMNQIKLERKTDDAEHKKKNKPQIITHEEK